MPHNLTLHLYPFPSPVFLYNLLPPAALTLILARPLLKHTFPPFTFTWNLTSSNPSESFSPILHISVTSTSPGFTGLANLPYRSINWITGRPAKLNIHCGSQ